jgi:hypothetical protein
MHAGAGTFVADDPARLGPYPIVWVIACSIWSGSVLVV